MCEYHMVAVKIGNKRNWPVVLCFTSKKEKKSLKRDDDKATMSKKELRVQEIKNEREQKKTIG